MPENPHFCLGRCITALALWLGTAGVSLAQSGVAVTPDGLNYLVNKDLRGERWTISLNLSAEDPARRLITNVTGNVFSAGEAPAFVVCQARPDSTGSLSDLESTFRFSCQGSSACLDTALSCSQGAWTVIAGDVQLPASFFLPESRVAATTRSPASSGHLGPQATPGTSDRGVTFSYDGLSYLVSKDVDNRRWSIVVNLSPRRTQDGLSRNELSSVTGNVFNRDGSPPQFVYCQTTDSSEGDFGNPKSVFRFRCQGADACVGTSEECARNGWRPISDSVEIPASFLLPPAGSGIPRSDPRLIIIGRTSDPSAVATDEFTPASGASSGFGRSEAPCEGACFANSIGPCTAVPGRLLTAADGRCVCLVENIADACIACGSDQCGRPCSFPVGSHDARGVCLPFDALGSGCLCNAVGADGSGLPELCAGALASQCPRGDKCCVDDPSDGCEPSAGDAQCAGLCASSAGCDAATQACGVCSDPCGNGTAEGLEECDRGDLREASCQEIGLGAGRLSCRADCRFDTTRCRGPTETPGPEDTPTPTPGTGGTPTPTPSALPATPTPTPGPSATPTPSPMATPTPSPEPPMPTCGSLGEACVVGTCCPGSFCSGGTCQPF